MTDTAEFAEAFREVTGETYEPAPRALADILISMQMTLEEILAQLQRANSIERTGSVSSVEIQDNPTKDLKVRVTSKQYTGSPLPVDEALRDHARLHREAEEKATNGWYETVAALGRKWADAQSLAEATDGDQIA